MCASNIKHGGNRNDSNTWVILDLDDTLVDTSDVYYMARETFLEEMVSLGFPRSQVLEMFERTETKNIKRLGIFPERYGQSMKETYRQLCSQKGIRPSRGIDHLIERIGRIVIQRIPQPLPGAIPLLKWLYRHYFVLLISRGIDHYQRRKIEAAGLEHFFDRFLIVDEKSVLTFTEIADVLGKDIRSAWVIGDSIKSDINPGIKAGARCILYEYRHKKYYWRQEYGKEPEGEYFLAKKLADIREIIKCPEKWPRQNSRLFRKSMR